MSYEIRGLKEWQSERGYLRDTCLSAQDKFKQYLDYFRVPYKEQSFHFELITTSNAHPQASLKA